VAGQPFVDGLTSSREPLQKAALARLRERLEDFGPDGLGIRLESLAVHDLHPPQEVVDAYHDVARAMEERDRQVNAAQAEAIRMKRRAEANQLTIVRDAESAGREKVRMAEASRDAFLARLHGRTTLPPSAEWQLLSDAAWSIAEGKDAPEVYRQYQERRAARIVLQTFLTDFRLSLETLVATLGKRDKVIVDAAKLPGRRHLLMFDPEWFRPPAPMILQGDRMPARSNRGEGP
jgi:regulator of protease activity HflC (stomatin/prohibitin superfamily)